MKVLRYLISLLPVLLVASLQAQDAESAAKTKLEEAVKELAATRALISQEKIPLAASLRELEDKVIGLRRERERMQRIVDNQSVDIAALGAQVKAYEDESSYTANLLNDYLNRANASLAVGEVPVFQPKLLDVMNRADTPNLAIQDKIGLQLDGLQVAFDRTAGNLGGAKFEVEAVLPGGKVASGTLVQIGPLGYFAAAAGGPAGVLSRSSSDTPALLVFDESSIPAIQTFVAESGGSLPVDTTMGRALAIATAEESFVEHFLAGGLWMWPIAFFGIVALAVALFKLLDILPIKPVSKETLSEVVSLVREDKIPEALHKVNGMSGPGAAMLKVGLQNIHLPKELMEEFLFETLLDVKPKLERGISFITLAASVAPLLGLLGTVTGMIETFKLLTLFGTGDAKSLSSGISEALITTEYGLVVAIPSLILGAIISRLVATRLAGLESMMITFANGVAEAKEAKVLAA